MRLEFMYQKSRSRVGNHCIAYAEVDCQRKRGTLASKHLVAPASRVEALLADIVLDIERLVRVVGTVGGTGKVLLPGHGARDLEVLLGVDLFAALANGLDFLGRTHCIFWWWCCR